MFDQTGAPNTIASCAYWRSLSATDCGESASSAEVKLMTEIRKGQGSWPLPREEFARRIRERFFDPTFDPLRESIDKLIDVAWRNYCDSRKSPRTRKAGPGFADADYELSVEWLEARERISEAEKRHANAGERSRILLICAASRNDKTCPGEMSKTFRLMNIAADALREQDMDVDVLDLSELASEPHKVILPCKACVSTAMPLCHWPCSCYPNHSLGQVDDWMSGIYPRWAAAHGVMIVTPVYWYQAPSGLKLMMDRLVCADGGNPDPTSTQGKDAALAKALELEGWSYPRHLAGRAFAVVVHGDAAGVDTLRRSLVDWLSDMELIQAGRAAALDRYIGYYQPYATSHEALDQDFAVQEEVRNAARSLANEVALIRAGKREPDERLRQPRPK
jgi:multimeric flavodoxin WrbA